MLGWLTVLEISVNAYQTGDVDAGRFACDRLRCLPETHPTVMDASRRNSCFYVEPLEAVARAVRLRRIDPGVPGRIDAPALALDGGDGGGAWMLVRVEAGGGSRWRLIALDREGVPAGRAGDLADALGLPDGRRMAGAQMFAQDGGLSIAGAAVPEDGGWPVLATAPLDLVRMSLGPASVAGEPDPTLAAAAWPAMQRNGQVLLLPLLGPTVAMTVRPGAPLGVESVLEAPRVADDLHAGTPPVPFGGGYLMVAREFLAYPGGPTFDLESFRGYDPFPGELLVAHRFVALDRSLRISGLTHPFAFRSLGKEACGGMVVSGDRVVLSWMRDRTECWTTSLPAVEVERMLRGVADGVMTGPFLGGPSGVAGPRAAASAAAAHRRTTGAASAFARQRLEISGEAQASWFAAFQPPAEPRNVRISVLLPTRGRPGLLARSVAALLDKALRPDAVEILLAVDADDVDTLAALPRMPEQVRSVVVPRKGYGRLHEYMNLLARLASGHWTMMWNDDNVMETHGWDEVICREPDCIGGLLSAHGTVNVTPVVPRHWLELVGHYSLQTHNDTWWESVADLTGLARVLEVEFTHDRADITGNNQDSTYLNRDYRTDEFWGEQIQAAIARDAASLKEWISFERSLAPDPGNGDANGAAGARRPQVTPGWAGRGTIT